MTAQHLPDVTAAKVAAMAVTSLNRTSRVSLRKVTFTAPGSSGVTFCRSTA